MITSRHHEEESRHHAPSRWFFVWVGAAAIAGAFGAGFVSGRISREGWLSRRDDRRVSEVRGAGGFRYINPLLECELGEDIPAQRELRPFKNDIVALIQAARESGQISYASVYFRQLNDGPWIGVAEREYYAPASLMKIPIAMAIYRRAEREPGILTRTLAWEGERDYNSVMRFRPPDSLEKGRAYTVEELVVRMLQYSDNNALNLLMRVTPQEEYQRILEDLDLRLQPGQYGMITVKNYSSILRVLYNASYLGRENSERILNILDHGSFEQGIAAGVPEEISVAHKYGEAQVELDGRVSNQFHEFAIVYHPSMPYLLGVMIRGADFEGMTAFTRNLSSLVWEKVNRAP
jgi:hypothetical protein